MTWFGWYSPKEENMYGYAYYKNKKGIAVCITKISQDPNFNHNYSDSVYHGELTHFMGVQKWNFRYITTMLRSFIKKHRNTAFDNILSTMEYEDNDDFRPDAPKKIIN